MAATSLPGLAVVLLLLLAASAAQATAGGKFMHSGARMVIIRRGPAGTRVGGAAGAHANKEWWYGRLLEDEVAPEEFRGLLGAGDGNVGYKALEKEKPPCLENGQCAAKPHGGAYTRPCYYKDQCPH